MKGLSDQGNNQDSPKPSTSMLPQRLIQWPHPASCHRQNLNISQIMNQKPSSSDNLQGLSSFLPPISNLHFSPYPIDNPSLTHIFNPLTLPPSFKFPQPSPNHSAFSGTISVPAKRARHTPKQIGNTVKSEPLISQGSSILSSSA